MGFVVPVEAHEWTDMALSQQSPGDDVSCSVVDEAEQVLLKRQATIFVVEDDTAGRESLVAWLTEKGFHSQAFASSISFLDEADMDRPGCVITDFRMPNLNGTDLQAAMQQRACLLPVILVSGFADVSVAVRAMQQGAVTLLEKPYHNEELLAAINTALERNSQLRKENHTNCVLQERLAELSDTQRQIMELLIAGQPNKIVAQQLDLGLRTVERHRQQILRLMQVESLPELATMVAKARPKSPAAS